MTGRMPTHVWVMAGLRQCNDASVPAFVRHKGEKTGGSVLIKLNYLDGNVRVLTQTRDFEGRPAWMTTHREAQISEVEAESYIERAIQRDPDLWVLEIEHREGWHPFEGKEI